jgi:hypothetical protein
VKIRKEKYGNGKTNGRPKKKSLNSLAERRSKDIVSLKEFQIVRHIGFCSH